ncbi:la-related protein 6-like [Limulus polyphemus]|uniref:La-related protein 6-like n=1 Tax=Limulus polyphemus TaxID=6850 RepID=A0ABM1C1K8_LIMPO|nr:la-related protein 6-like [Limulus polyphemus]
MILDIHTSVNMLNTADTQNCFSPSPICDQTDNEDSGSEGCLLTEVPFHNLDVEGYDCRSSTTCSTNEGDGNSLDCCKEGTDSDGEKDSGIECPKNADDFPQPDKVVVENIVKQVEYYFSNANLLKDPFLLKHVRRNKQGYVSLKLITSFRKVKSFTKNWRVVACSLRYSKELEINEEGTKVRRKDPLPDYDETPPSRTVVAFKLPFEKPTVEKIGEIFSKYGTITLIRIIHPSKAIPADIKTFLYKHPEIGSSVCALVEFENRESACRAWNGFFPKSIDWRSMQVIPLVPKDYFNVNSNGDENKNKGNELKKRKNGKRQARAGQLRKGETPTGNGCPDKGKSFIESTRLSASPKSTSTWPKWNQEPTFRRNTFTANHRSSNGPISSQNISKPLVCPMSNNHSDGDSLKPFISPWVQRRLTQGRERGCTFPTHNTRLLIPDGVIRLPKGPDGTTGFNWSLLKLRTQSAPI